MIGYAPVVMGWFMEMRGKLSVFAVKPNGLPKGSLQIRILGGLVTNGVMIAKNGTLKNTLIVASARICYLLRILHPPTALPLPPPRDFWVKNVKTKQYFKC